MSTADNPWAVGFNLITGLDNAFILGYSFLIMSFLGWAAGAVLFIVGMCICFYCNCVTGTLHTLGGQRNIHFRDLARVGFGEFENATFVVMLIMHKAPLLCMVYCPG